MRKVELFIETIIFQSRWMLAPFYLGLALSLCCCSIISSGARRLRAQDRRSRAESDVILGVLSLIDLAFTGNLMSS